MGGASSTSMTAPAAVVKYASARHTATVIFLHGLGDTGHGWADILQQQCNMPHVKYICPNAPEQPVTLNGGMRMPSWFDIRGLSPDVPEDEVGIKKASADLQALIADEVKQGITTDRIVLGGFSQGGAVSVYTTLLSQKPFAGLVGLSTWLPLRDGVLKELQSANKNIPILQCHGDADPVVPLTWGKATMELIEKFNANIDYRTYKGMGHSSCPEEMKAVKEFLEKHIPPV